MATQAIHLPALAALANDIAVVRCTDPDPVVAAAVAKRSGSKPAASYDELLDDPAVDVVLVASPDAVHAQHVIAACSAGKRAVLCEKPLASTIDDADAVVKASESTSVPVIVATMHAYDAALAHLFARHPELVGQTAVARSVA